MDFVGRKIRLQLANELPKTFSALSYRGGERTIELAVQQKLPVLRIEAHDIGRQHIDGEIRRELRNALAVLLGKAVSLIACHEVSTHAFATALDARGRRILRLSALYYRARAPAFLNLEFRSINWPPNRRPCTRLTRAPPSQLCKQDVVAGPNVVKSGSHDLRVST